MPMHKYKSEIKRFQHKQEHKQENSHAKANNKRYRRANVQFTLPQHRLHQLV